MQAGSAENAAAHTLSNEVVSSQLTKCTTSIEIRQLLDILPNECVQIIVHTPLTTAAGHPASHDAPPGPAQLYANFVCMESPPPFATTDQLFNLTACYFGLL